MSFRLQLQHPFFPEPPACPVDLQSLWSLKSITREEGREEGRKWKGREGKGREVRGKEEKGEEAHTPREEGAVDLGPSLLTSVLLV
jgi:hypothetical protein